MAQWLGAPAGSSRGPKVQLTTHVQWCTTSYNSSFRWTDALFWPLWMPLHTWHMCMHMCTCAHTYKQILKVPLNLSITYLFRVHFSSQSSGILLFLFLVLPTYVFHPFPLSFPSCSHIKNFQKSSFYNVALYYILHELHRCTFSFLFYYRLYKW